jgi:diguanylate cyclase
MRRSGRVGQGGEVERVTRRSGAAAFARRAGPAALGAALGAVSVAGGLAGSGALPAVVALILCAGLVWLAAERAMAAAAINVAVERLAAAASGDLASAVPAAVQRRLPPLARAMDGLFRQLGASMDGMAQVALFDPVTELPNRTHFRRSAERVLAGLAPDAPAALIFIDLDRFKAVNDSLGHASGDGLLAMVANRLRRVVAERSDAPVIGRLAGDEFTILLPAVADRAEAGRIGEAILQAMARPFSLADQAVTIGASIGIATRPGHGRTLNDLMRAADAAMYHAKQGGRGRVAHFSDALAAEIAGRAQLESDLRDAVGKDQLALVYQPQVSAANGQVVGAEALLRWRHPGGTKLPASFIQRAEDTGLIVEIGDWVVHSVADTIARWARLGLEQRLAVNISPRQIDHADFFHGLRRAMQAAAAPARLLELEITETLATHCSPAVIAAIARLRADGASIAIDDFGTGYSNLACLRRFPADRIKLDRNLVERVVEDPAARAIAQAVIGLVHGLGCQAVAEGIESEAQAAVLQVLGCDVLQGYAIALPMAEEQFLHWAEAAAPRRAAS